MRKALLPCALAVPLGVAVFAGACSDNGGSAGDSGADALPDVPRVLLDGASDATTAPDSADVATPDAAADAPPAGSLILSLDPMIDVAGDTVKAKSLTSVALLDATGTPRANASLTSGVAIVRLFGLGAGDYFLEVNGDADDLVPTRIDDPALDILQTVGTALRASVIGPHNAPLYRINTYSAGQAKTGIVKYSDGTPVTPSEQVYLLLTLGTPKIEVKVLGTGVSVSSYTPMSAVHPGSSEPFDAWLVMTNGQDHHGDMFNSDGGAAMCGSCHTNMDTKPATHASISPGNGWCYQCHYGTGGNDNGFVDPAK